MKKFCIFIFIAIISSSLIHGYPDSNEQVEVTESGTENLTENFNFFNFNFSVKFESFFPGTILITQCPEGRELIGGVCRKKPKVIVTE